MTIVIAYNILLTVILQANNNRNDRRPHFHETLTVSPSRSRQRSTDFLRTRVNFVELAGQMFFRRILLRKDGRLYGGVSLSELHVHTEITGSDTWWAPCNCYQEPTRSRCSFGGNKRKIWKYSVSQSDGLLIWKRFLTSVTKAPTYFGTYPRTCFTTQNLWWVVVGSLQKKFHRRT